MKIFVPTWHSDVLALGRVLPGDFGLFSLVLVVLRTRSATGATAFHIAASRGNHRGLQKLLWSLYHKCGGDSRSTYIRHGDISHQQPRLEAWAGGRRRRAREQCGVGDVFEAELGRGRAFVCPKPRLCCVESQKVLASGRVRAVAARRKRQGVGIGQ